MKTSESGLLSDYSFAYLIRVCDTLPTFHYPRFYYHKIFGDKYKKMKLLTNPKQFISRESVADRASRLLAG